MITSCALLDGTFGIRGDLPPSWQLAEQGRSHGVWRTEDADVVVVQHVHEPILVEPELLDEYRLDLRLMAAGRGGGLVECELDDGWGVAGVTKEPQATGRGCSVRGQVLVPTRDGHLEVGVLAHEGPVTGVREGGVLLERRRPGQGLPPDWLGDPYGYLYRRPPRDTDFQRRRLPRDLLLRCRSDDRSFDRDYPGHPLSRVRRALAAVRRGLDRSAPPAVVPPPPRILLYGVSFDLPRGLLATGGGRLHLGHVFHRFTFAERASFLTVCRHPELPECGRTLEGAQLLVGRYVQWAGNQLLQGPRLVERTVGGRRGIYLEYESRTAARELYTAAFYLPWGDHSLEISCAGERDDWERANRDLEEVVESLGDVAGAAKHPPTLDLAVGRPKGVSNNGLRRIFGALCALAHCDGQVSREERSVLDAYQSRYGIPPTEARRLEAESAPGELVRLGRGLPERDALLDALVEVVVADGILDPAEEKRLRRIARAMGVPEADLLGRVHDRLA